MKNKKNVFILTVFLSVFFFTICQQDTDENEKKDAEENPDLIQRVIDSAVDAGYGNSIKVDGSNIYVSYYDWTNNDLRFAKSTNGGATWLPANIITVDSLNDVGWGNSIAVSSTNIYISYYDNTNKNLKFAKSTDGGATWLAANIKIIDSVGDVGYYNSITADGSNIYISYYDWTNLDLKFTKSTDGGATWPAANIKIIDSLNDVGKYSSIAVDGSDVYVSYYYQTNDDLKFARSTDGGATWLPANIKTVESDGLVGEYTGIAVNESNIYISYYDETNSALKFARSTDSGAAWPFENIKTIDSADNVGKYNSITANGYSIYISYRDSTNGNLKFAKSINGGVTWPFTYIKEVDSADDVGFYTSIAADGSNIYISYYDLTNTDLKFAKSINSGAIWQ